MAYCPPCSYKMNGKNYSWGKMAMKRDGQKYNEKKNLYLTLNSVALGIAVYGGARASLYSQHSPWLRWAP